MAKWERWATCLSGLCALAGAGLAVRVWWLARDAVGDIAAGAGYGAVVLRPSLLRTDVGGARWWAGVLLVAGIAGSGWLAWRSLDRAGWSRPWWVGWRLAAVTVLVPAVASVWLSLADAAGRVGVRQELTGFYDPGAVVGNADRSEAVNQVVGFAAPWDSDLVAVVVLAFAVSAGWLTVRLLRPASPRSGAS
ncbi:hypothetical protein AB0M43_27985 [Longispora sp. NPDC051575]|uniref:hypothetical protein n=1 Tax=Longispora sp. NPDC051575 TaxID=3154943 RepID=UPI003416EECD